MKAVKSVDLKNQKVQQILAGAKDAFLELGYEGTSVEEIARRSGVSKATLYNYFPDKQRIFAFFAEIECEEQARRMCNIINDVGDLEDGLRQIAKSYIEFIVSPFFRGMFRVIVGELVRFPELGRTFYDSGPDICIRRLSQYLVAATARGEISVGETKVAAHQFFALCRAELFYKILFGLKHDVKDEEIDRIVDTAVTTFLQIYIPERLRSGFPSGFKS